MVSHSTHLVKNHESQLKKNVIVLSAKLKGVKPGVLQLHKQLNLVGYCIKSSGACCVLWNDILRLISGESA